MLKFRAWDIENKKMLYNVVPIHGGLSCAILEITYEGIIKPTKLILKIEPIMQSIGLNDIEDQELYQKDIIELPNKDICVIEYIESRFVAIPKPKSLYGFKDCVYWYSKYPGVKKLGNIYENFNLI